LGADTMRWLDRLDAEVDNIGAALEWAFESDPVRAIQLCVAFVPYWRTRSLRAKALPAWLVSLAVDILRRAAALVPSLPLPGPGEERDRTVLISRLLSGLAWSEAVWGSAARGVGPGDEAVRLAHKADDPRTLAEAMGARNLVAIFAGDPNLRDMHAEASRAAEMAEDWWLFAMIEAGWAVREAADGDIAAAEGRLEKVTAAANRIGNPFVQAFAMLTHGRVAGFAKRLPDVRRWFASTIAAYEDLEDQHLIVIARSDFAHALRHAGVIDEAEELYVQTIHFWQHFGNRGAVANQLECFAFIAIERDDLPRAARLFGAAETIRAAADARMVEHERIEYEAALSVLRERLDPSTLESAWAEGRQLSLEEAVQSAVGGAPAAA
ncbi:MAG: hypothetical protein ACR2GO_06190, partial [Candidatus Limnocylindria bacterium]